MIRIEEFKKEYLNEWLDFFDKRAFKDNPDWKSCYCTCYHKPKEIGINKEETKTNRNYAIYMINTNKLKGYAAFNEDNKIIGWCNVNQKNNYQRLIHEFGVEEDISTVSVVCFLIEKEYRNQGIATALLKKIITDMKQRGKESIEAYPAKRSKLESGNYHGTYSTYLKLGFSEERVNNKLLMRLKLT